MLSGQSTKRFLVETLEVLIFAFILSWGLRSTVVEANNYSDRIDVTDNPVTGPVSSRQVIL